MNISPYLNLNRIEFIVTYQCSGKCKHCSLGNKLNHKNGFNHINQDKAIEFIKKIADTFNITSVMTFGGEPLLYSDVVCAIHETAHLCGIEQRQIITNGYFTKDSEQCRQVAFDLKKASVNNLLISVDAFHQETIPIDAVHNFAKYAYAADIPKIQLQPAWVVNKEHDNRYNTKTKEILAKLNDLDIAVSDGNDISLTGNAVANLSEFYDKPKMDLSIKCGDLKYTTPLNSITSLSVVPNGNVMICGFVIGNIYENNIEDIISRYNPYNDEWMSAALNNGISGLKELVAINKYDIDYSECFSVCDLCHKINDVRMLF